MSEFASLVLNGLSMGAVYALVALGFVIIFKATEVINFALPSLLVSGTLVVAVLHHSFRIPFYASAPLGVFATAIIGIIVDRTLMRTFYNKQAIIAASIMTIGLSIIVDTLAMNWIGANIMSIGGPWGSDTVHIFTAAIPLSRLVALAVALCLLVAFYFWLQRSDFGVAMRAAADDPETASLMGVKLSRVTTVSWALGLGLAVVAGIFLVSYPRSGLDVTVGSVALLAIPAVVIGGLDSTTGAVVGGLIVGLTQMLTLGYQNELAFLGRDFNQYAPYILMFLVLLIRPAGLFGTSEVSRV
jgi:branched-chain amino acid transport system permease protein